MQTDKNQKALEDKVRRAAKKKGLQLRKSRRRNHGLSNVQGYDLVDIARNMIVYGSGFSLNLESAMEICSPNNANLQT